MGAWVYGYMRRWIVGSPILAPNRTTPPGCFRPNDKYPMGAFGLTINTPWVQATHRTEEQMTKAQVWLYVRVCVRVYGCMSVRVYLCMGMSVCVHGCMCVCMHGCMCVCMCVVYAWFCGCLRINTGDRWVLGCMCMAVRTRHQYTHAHIHTYTHTQHEAVNNAVHMAESVAVCSNHIHIYIHEYTQTHIHTYTHTHKHIHTYTHTHIHTYTHTHIHIYTYTHAHKHMHLSTHP